MQIIAGRFRGRRLKSPPGRESRPTLSRIRQALFNILMSRIPGTGFLDLYAGAGSIGLEAFSRGSMRVVLVESDRTIAAALRENAETLDPEGRSLELIQADAHAAARRLLDRRESFDLIFLDPPYHGEQIRDWDRAGVLDRLLADGGCVVYQHGRREALPEEWAGLRKSDERHYGKTTLSFFERRERKSGNGEDCL